jgi:vacuolar-type H+-ATPase subunit I/STV1
MNYKLLFGGIAFLIVGLLMFYNVKRRKPASEQTDWKGQLVPQYIQFWIIAILCIIVGIVFILESLAT